MGTLGYGYRFWIAVPGQNRTLFHGVTGMPVLGFWSCESVDMLFVGYTFVYNDMCGPSNTPPSPQKQDRGLCFWCQPLPHFKREMEGILLWPKRCLSLFGP